MNWIQNILLGLDETGNAALGGSPRETISGTVGRALQAGAWWAPYAAWFVNLIMMNPQHCQQAAAIEAERRAADIGIPQ